jgi:hypothetical protein
MIIPADRQAEEQAAPGGIRAGQAITHRDTMRRRKDGTLVPVSRDRSSVCRRSRATWRPSKIRSEEKVTKGTPLLAHTAASVTGLVTFRWKHAAASRSASSMGIARPASMTAHGEYRRTIASTLEGSVVSAAPPSASCHASPRSPQMRSKAPPSMPREPTIRGKACPAAVPIGGALRGAAPGRCHQPAVASTGCAGAAAPVSARRTSQARNALRAW